MAKPKKEVKGQGMKFTNLRKDNTNAFDLKGRLFLKGKIVESQEHGRGRIEYVQIEDEVEMVHVRFDVDLEAKKDATYRYKLSELQEINDGYCLASSRKGN